jgi:hypothetical protein
MSRTRLRCGSRSHRTSELAEGPKKGYYCKACRVFKSSLRRRITGILNGGIKVVPDEETEEDLEARATAVRGMLLSALNDLVQKVENLLGCDRLDGLLACSPIAGDGRRCITRKPVEEKAVILTACF